MENPGWPAPRALVFVYGPALRSPLGRGHQLARHFADRLPVIYVPYRSVVELLMGDAGAPSWAPLARHPAVRHVPMPLTTFLTRRSRLASRLHGALAAARVRKELRRMQVAPSETLFFAEHAMATDVVHYFPEARVVYDCADDLRNWDRNSPAMCRLYGELEDDLVRRASHVVLSTPRFARHFPGCGAELIEGPNGIDDAFLSGPTKAPEDLRSLPRPWLLFVGVLSSYLDADLVTALGRSGLGSVVLVGPRDPRSPIGRLGPVPNVHWLGRKAYEALPSYVHTADVALIPVTQAAASDRVPTKLFMYCAAGCPVVATRCSSLEPYRGLVRLPGSHREFIDQVRVALREPGAGRHARVTLAREHTWPRLSGRLLDRLGVPDVALSAASEVSDGTRSLESRRDIAFMA